MSDFSSQEWARYVIGVEPVAIECGCAGACAECTLCREHLHPADGAHYCPAKPRVDLARFTAELVTATAVFSRQGLAHAVDCPIVKAHITSGEAAVISAETPGSDPRNWQSWEPWIVTRKILVTGKRCKLCSPVATVQGRPKPLVARLTGLGWPNNDGTCAKGRLPAWARERRRPTFGMER